MGCPWNRHDHEELAGPLYQSDSYGNVLMVNQKETRSIAFRSLLMSLNTQKYYLIVKYLNYCLYDSL